jgi:hypothetical protein
MRRKWRWVLGCGLAVALMTVAGPGWAAEIEFGWQGTVTAVDASLAAALPPGSGIEVGADAWVKYVFESTTPDADSDPTVGDYQGALVSWTTRVGGYTFRHDPAGSKNAIGIAIIDDFFGPTTLYEPVDSVISTPPLPGSPTPFGEVFFIDYSANKLPDDSLPTAPLEPGTWDESATGIFDAGCTGCDPLIDINLTAVCLGSCQPSLQPPDVPLGAAGGLSALLLLSGAGYLRSRGRRGARA